MHQEIIAITLFFSELLLSSKQREGWKQA